MPRGIACTPPQLRDMRLGLPLLASALLLAGCATPPLRPTAPLVAWNERVTALEQARTWQLDGRAAAALGEQGWQASLDWRQKGSRERATSRGTLRRGRARHHHVARGLSLNGAPPTPAMTAQLQARLGFELPLDVPAVLAARHSESRRTLRDHSQRAGSSATPLPGRLEH